MVASPVVQSQGLHHITLNGADRKTSIDFWEGILGMPFIFEQPNLDDPDENHLYFDPGDSRLITIFTNEKRSPHKSKAAFGYDDKNKIAQNLNFSNKSIVTLFRKFIILLFVKLVKSKLLLLFNLSNLLIQYGGISPQAVPTAQKKDSINILEYMCKVLGCSFPGIQLKASSPYISKLVLLHSFDNIATLETKGNRIKKPV